MKRSRTLTLVKLAVVLLLSVRLFAQGVEQPRVPEGWASHIYRELGDITLDPAQVYQIRDAALEREDLHVQLQDGAIAFTRAVDGHITGAAFEGHGEVLLIPPDRVERWSLNVFTGSAILEEGFTSAYIRFNDDTFEELRPYLRPPEDAEAMIARWQPVIGALSHSWTLRLLRTIVNGTSTNAEGATVYRRDPEDRFFAARVWGVRSGLFDLIYDSKAPEQIAVAHLGEKQGAWYYDLWASFPSRSQRNLAAREKNITSSSATITTQAGAEAFAVDSVQLTNYELKVRVLMPRTIAVEAQVEARANRGGERFLQFELSRFLSVSEVTANGHPVEFVQNAALQGTELAKRGNDNVSVILPKALVAGEQVQLHFSYRGDVMEQAGGGLMYVGAHGDWYPTRGLSMSRFDMVFRYPSDWMLVATGKRQEPASKVPGGEQVSRWISERPMPFAGFNLGKYEVAAAKAGDVVVEAYAAKEVESSLRQQQQTVLVVPGGRPGFGPGQDVIVSEAPSPASQAERVAKEGAKTIEFYSEGFGGYPYSSLALTQMPGTDSQSWPGMIYLSSYVFLTPEQRAYAHVSPIGSLMYQRLMEQHEIGHQWWGDLLIWKSYREQWIVEALSNYCALMKLEEEDASQFREILNQYRRDLLAKNDSGAEVTEAGPVTLGVRLNSSRFPHAYNTISYGRGTWLFHMLRTMLEASGEGGGTGKSRRSSEAFFRVLRRLRDRYEGKEITTRELQKLFEEELPVFLHYEGRKSLDWFFDGWVNGTSIPRFTMSDVKFAAREKKLVATGKIVQSDAPEGMVTSVPIYAAGSRGNSLLGRVFVEGPETHVRFVVPTGTKKLLIDPNETILARP